MTTTDAELGRKLRERMSAMGKVRSKKKLASACRNVKLAQRAAKKKGTVKLARAALARKRASDGQGD